jgi:general secretion pathway protein N
MAGSKMMRRRTIIMVLLALSAHGASALTVISNEPLDADIVDGVPAAGSPVESLVRAAPIAPAQVIARPPAPAVQRSQSNNPLWAIPLNELSGTRDRPIFSSSRRPPPAAVAADPAAPKPAPAPKPREPERPQISLVGTIASDDEGFGIFLEQSTKSAIRLKVGEDYQGWRLRLIQGREVTLEKDQQAAVLSLPQPGGGTGGEVRLLPASAVRLLSVRSLPPASELRR